MLKFNDFIRFKKADPESDTLHAFDIDETLFAHDHNKLRVHVHDPAGNRVRSLTNQEFNNHDLPPGHKYDFSEFRSSDRFAESATPIRKMISKLKAIHRNNKNVIGLTARSDLDSQPKFAHFMKKYGMDIDKDIHIVRAGNMEGMKSADAKALAISQLIKKHGYNKIHLYDDSLDNIKGMFKLKSDHPEVEFHGHHVQHDPETGKVVITKQSVVPKKDKDAKV
jgi:hypothetical protein